MSDKKKNILIGVLVSIIVVLIVLIVLVVTGVVNFDKKGDKLDNTDVDQSSDVVILDASEYISLEDVEIVTGIATKKVKFDHLSDEVTNQFYQEQDEMIDDIKKTAGDVDLNVYLEENNTVKYDLKYGINGNILSVVYSAGAGEILPICPSEKVVVNIDLANNKAVTEEELLEMANTSYDKLANEFYDEELKSWEELNARVGSNVDYGNVTFNDFKNNKTKYVNDALDSTKDLIYVYIEDGKIKYDYYALHKLALFHEVGKGGCSNVVTEVLGEYK